MSLIKKPWGHKITIMDTDHAIVDHLFIKPGGYSSVHKHKLLKNCFYVLNPEDTLEIQVFEVDIDMNTRSVNPVDHVVVSSENNGIIVPPGIYHRFRNPHEDRNIVIIEVSFLSIIRIEDDIFRVPGFDVGGFSE